MAEIVYPKFRWFTFGALVATIASVTVILLSPVSVGPEIARTSGMDMGKVIFLTMVLLDIPIIIGAMLGGGLIDKFSVGKVWAVAMVMVALGSALVLTPMGNDAIGWIVIRMLHGLGIGTVFAGIPAVVAQWFPAKERSIVVGLTSGAAPLGAAIGLSFVPAVMLRTGSWQIGVGLAAIFPLLAFVLALVAIFGPQPPVKDARMGPPGSGPGGPGGPPGSWGEVKVALLLPVTWAACVVMFFSSWELRSFNSMTASYLSLAPPVGVGLGAMKAGLAMSTVQFAGLAGSLLGGFIVEKIFGGRIRPLLLIGFAASAFCYFSIRSSSVYSNHILLTGCLWTVAFFLAMLGPQVMGFITKNYPPHMMGKLGGALAGNVSTIGGLIGAGVASYSLSKTGYYNASFTIFLVSAVIGIGGSFALISPKIFARWETERVADNNREKEPIPAAVK